MYLCTCRLRRKPWIDDGRVLASFLHPRTLPEIQDFDSGLGKLGI